jgi:ABC-2 type transport system ATP-binding protein
VEVDRGHAFLRDVVDAFPAEVRSVTFGKPTLEDAFIRLAGHGLGRDDPEDGLQPQRDT